MCVYACMYVRVGMYVCMNACRYAGMNERSNVGMQYMSVCMPVAS